MSPSPPVARGGTQVTLGPHLSLLKLGTELPDRYSRVSKHEQCRSMYTFKTQRRLKDMSHDAYRLLRMGILVSLEETKYKVLGDACADCLIHNLAKSLLVWE